MARKGVSKKSACYTRECCPDKCSSSYHEWGGIDEYVAKSYSGPSWCSFWTNTNTGVFRRIDFIFIYYKNACAFNPCRFTRRSNLYIGSFRQYHYMSYPIRYVSRGSNRILCRQCIDPSCLRYTAGRSCSCTLPCYVRELSWESLYWSLLWWRYYVLYSSEFWYHLPEWNSFKKSPKTFYTLWNIFAPKHLIFFHSSNIWISSIFCQFQ